MEDNSRIQFVGKLDEFIVIMHAANAANDIPQMTAEELSQARMNKEKFEAEQKAKQQAEIDQRVRDGVAAAMPPAAAGTDSDTVNSISGT
jgi:hypothetical protein